MAERRMFAKTIIDSDFFLELPMSSQLLYFHLSMRADDEGFINKPKAIMKMVGAKDDDMNMLIAKKFVIPFESGVVVIKHWKIHNYIRGDRLLETKYKEERDKLEIDENGSYRLCQSTDSHMVGKVDTQVSIGKDSIGKDSKDNKESRHKFGEYKNVLLTNEEFDKLQNEFPNDYFERIDKLSCYMKSTGKHYKDHLATIRNWARMDAERNKNKSNNNGFQKMLRDEEDVIDIIPGV